MAPIPDLQPKDLTVKPDGSVTFRLVAGVKTGYYEFWVLGDLDTAFGSLTIEACGEVIESGTGGTGTGGGASTGIDSFKY